jgi:cytochrome c oxidase subunit 3
VRLEQQLPFTPAPRPTAAKTAIRFFVGFAAALGAGGTVAWFLIHFVNTRLAVPKATLQPAFGAGTLLLVAGSTVLQRALHHVRLEHQRPFRRSMLAAVALGILFVGVQSYGLWCLVQGRMPADASTGVAFVFVFAALHGMHFLLALMCVVFVALRAFQDWYDHEYYWGVTVCAWFWHFLGIVWGAILMVLVITSW